MILDRRLVEIDPPTDPVAWLAKHDTDAELHNTIKALLHPPGMNRPRVAEAVLVLEAYIALTAPIRAQVPGWGDEWTDAVLRLSRFRSIRQVLNIQKLLRATRTGKAHKDA